MSPFISVLKHCLITTANQRRMNAYRLEILYTGTEPIVWYPDNQASTKRLKKRKKKQRTDRQIHIMLITITI